MQGLLFDPLATDVIENFSKKSHDEFGTSDALFSRPDSQTISITDYLQPGKIRTHSLGRPSQYESQCVNLLHNLHLYLLCSIF